MSENLTEINCLLCDCIFYHDAGKPDKALCSHKDAHRYIHTEPPCPIYRLDWQKKMASAKIPFKPSPMAKKKY